MSSVLAQLTDPESLDVAQRIRVARCHLDVLALEEAERWASAALAGGPVDAERADALHTIGSVAKERGDESGAVAYWLRVRALDLAAPRPDWSLSPEQLEAEVEWALGELPERVREHLADVPILAADYPDEDLVRDGWDPRLLGFFDGVPLPEKAAVGEGPLGLDTVLLFQRNIERFAGDPYEAREEIRVTLLHETGHFFGLSDEDLDLIGLG